MTSVNALATLLEAFFCRHTDTKALLYPCCTCARGVMSKIQEFLERKTGNVGSRLGSSAASRVDKSKSMQLPWLLLPCGQYDVSNQQ